MVRAGIATLAAAGAPGRWVRGARGAGSIRVVLSGRACPPPPRVASPDGVWRRSACGQQRLRRPSSPACATPPRGPRSSAAAALRAAPALRMQAGRTAASATTIEAARGGFEEQSGDKTMAQIGTFTRGDDGSFTGTIRTLNITVKASIKPVPKGKASAAPTIGSPPTVSSSARAGARSPRTPAPSTSRSSSTTPPSRLRSTPAWSPAKRASTSSSGRADRIRGAPLNGGRHYSIT